MGKGKTMEKENKTPVTGEENKPIEQPTEETKPVEQPVEETPNNEPTKAEDMEKVLAEVERLKEELAQATAKATEVQELSTQMETLKNESTKNVETIQKYEKVLTDMVEKKVESIPEKYRDLIPVNLDILSKLDCLNKAEEAGLFVKEQAQKPNVEIGKPMNVDVPQVDTSRMSGSQLLKYAYGVIKK